MHYPQWATPARRAFLVELFMKSRGFCVYGHDPCPHLDRHGYEVVSEDLIALWISQDKEEREVLWQKEQRELHRLPQIRKRGRFDSLRRQEYLDNRPIFRILAVGVNAFTQHRTAQVEIPGLQMTIWVDLWGIRSPKVKFRKLVRYVRGAIPRAIEQEVFERVARVVAQHL